MKRSPRTLTAEDRACPRPVYVVWELTLQCDQACRHCGSRAGRARGRELDTREVEDVGRQLADLGCREVTLIGGEAYLRPDYLHVVRFLADLGLRVTLLTGGRRVDREMVSALREAGLGALGVSVDGLREAHEWLRGVPGGFHRAIAVLDLARAIGLTATANTQVNRRNRDQLPDLAELLQAHGTAAWQVQLTVPMGRAADRPELLVQPWEILALVETLGAIQVRALERARREGGRAFDVCASDNVGYFGPHELAIRSRPGRGPSHFAGCTAGRHVLGLQADGSVKACLSLPEGGYVAGSTREVPLAALWEGSPAIRLLRERTQADLWGFCATCYYAEVCRGGCTATTHALLARPGNDPLCWYRADQLRRRGLRERLVPREQAPATSFGVGRFALVEEPWDSPGPADQPVSGTP